MKPIDLARGEAAETEGARAAARGAWRDHGVGDASLTSANAEVSIIEAFRALEAADIASARGALLRALTESHAAGREAGDFENGIGDEIEGPDGLVFNLVLREHECRELPSGAGAAALDYLIAKHGLKRVADPT